MKPLAVGADSVCDHGIGHAVAYSTSFIQKFIAILTTWEFVLHYVA